METIDRITQRPDVMGGKPSVWDMRVTVGTIVGQIAEGVATKRPLIAKVQEWLGHANVSTTRVYDHRKTHPEGSPTFKAKY